MRYVKEIDLMLKENLIGEEDKKLATFVMGLFKQSPEVMSRKKDKDYKKWFKNLRKNGVLTEDMKINVDENFEKYSGIEFVLMMACAKDYIKRVQEVKK